jgi:translation initiation factor IF-2
VVSANDETKKPDPTAGEEAGTEKDDTEGHAMQGGPRPTGAMQGGPRPTGAMQGGPRPTGAMQGGPRPTGAMQGGPRPTGEDSSDSD